MCVCVCVYKQNLRRKKLIGLVSLFDDVLNLHWLFNAKSILVEEDLW